ncbi:hypothetical protein ACF0H5_005528 [Mactra antiquata]
MSVTPKCGDKKRDASSPLDEDSLKKSRIKSTNSESENYSISLSDEHIIKIAEVLKDTFNDQLTDMVSNVADKVVGNLIQSPILR